MIYLNRFDTIHACDGVTDGQTDRQNCRGRYVLLSRVKTERISVELSGVESDARVTNYRIIIIKVTSVTILKHLLKHFNPSTVRPSVPPAPVL